jgi:LacI family transcriptional regulator
MAEPIRIKDIAERVGVSSGTVDRVIHKRGHVSAALREKIELVMEEMGYEPNIAARTLAHNRKATSIAVILPDYRTDPYWEQPKEGVERAAESVRHYGAMVEFYFFPIFEPQTFLSTVSKVLETQPDAVLVAPLFLKEAQFLFAECAQRNIPIVLINTQIEDNDELTYIGQDSYQSGVLAGRLLNFGLNDGDHALLVNLDKEVASARHLQEKERGFKDFFNGIENKSVIIHTAVQEDFDDPQKMKAWAEEQLDENPQLKGFFVTNSRAYKLVEALPPAFLKKAKIVGFDLIAPNLRLLEAGKIQFLINQNAWHQGYYGILTIVNQLILKKKTQRILYLPLDIIVKENAEYYLSGTVQSPLMVV